MSREPGAFRDHPKPVQARVRHTVRTGIGILGADALRGGLSGFFPPDQVLRALSCVGLGLVLFLLISILFNDLLRLGGGLVPLDLEASATRGLLVPAIVVPLTVIAMTFAWGYLLTGALHGGPRLRWTVLGLYIFYGLSQLYVGVFGTSAKLAPDYFVALGVISVLLLLALIFCFVLLPRRQLPFTVEFGLISLLNGALTALALFQSGDAEHISLIPFLTSTVGTNITQSARVLITPFLLITGTEMVRFGQATSGWITGAVRRHAWSWVAGLLLLVLLGYRLAGLAGMLLASAPDAGQWQRWLGASLLLLGMAPLLAWRRRRESRSGISTQLIALLVVILVFNQLLLSLATLLIGLVFLLPGQWTDILGELNRIETVILGWSDLYSSYSFLIVAASGLVVALIAGRRKSWSVASFGLLLAWTQLVGGLTSSGRALDLLAFEYQDVDVVLLLALSALTLFWLARRELSAARSLRLLGIAMLAAILNQTNFLDNPFSPLFGFAGVFFLVFGIFWSVLTGGGQFLEGDSPGLPHTSRLMLYLGYVLLSVSVAHWYIISHNVVEQTLQHDFTLGGFRIYGLPLAYLVMVEGGAALAEGEDIAERE